MATLTETFTNIADAIRLKTETTDKITPDNMPSMIESITTGGTAEPAVIQELSITSNGTYRAPEGIDGYTPVIVNVPQDGSPSAEALVISGDCGYRFANNGWNWFLNQYGNQITTKDISYLSNMFYASNVLENIPFEINIAKYGSSYNADKMFYNCKKLKNVPNVNNFMPSATNDIFYGCDNLREIPDSFCNTWDWSFVKRQTSGYSCSRSASFKDCSSLRKIPEGFIEHVNPYISSSYSIQYTGFYGCYVLDEITNLAVPEKATWTYNSFSSAFHYCFRLKKLTFKMNDDGTPKVANWKDQIIDLSYGGMIPTSITYITGRNSGITADKEVYDDATYQALKDDLDWFSLHYDYARYNRTSAVETINSLPDTSVYLATAGGTNTIKFKGFNGGKTDGGAINTMTEEEIAVAAAKGWTVSFV